MWHGWDDDVEKFYKLKRVELTNFCVYSIEFLRVLKIKINYS